MDHHRVRRAALALGVFAILLTGRVGHGQTAPGDTLPASHRDRLATDREEFSPDTPATESPLSGRPTPFYEADDPIVAPREAHAQRVPMRAVKPVAISEPTEIGGPWEATRLEKTPLPDSEFTDAAEPTPATPGRSGFGSSVAWALGILAVGWLARQFLKSGGSLSSLAPSAIELLSRQSIGPQQQLALVRFGRRMLLVGALVNGRFGPRGAGMFSLAGLPPILR